MINYNVFKVSYPFAAYSFTAIHSDSINKTGQIAGGYYDSSMQYHGFVKNNGSFTNIDPIGSKQTIISGINASGQVAGIYRDNIGTYHGFIQNGGAYSSVDPVGATSTNVNGINDYGQVFGSYIDTAGKYHGYVNTSGSVKIVDVPNSATTQVQAVISSGLIYGIYSDNSGTHGFINNNGIFTSVNAPGSLNKYTYITDVNEAGQIVGGYYDSANKYHGFVDNNGVFTTIDPAGSSATYVTSINSSGQIAGYYTNNTGSHGFAYIDGAFTSVDPISSTTTVVTGISDSGEIVGYYYPTASGSSIFTASSSPPAVVAENTSVVAGQIITGTGGIAGTGALAGDSDPNGYPLSILDVTGGKVGAAVAGQYGHLTLNADGSYSYAADNAAAIAEGPTGSHLHDVFSYTVSDGFGGTASSSLNVSLDRAPVVTAETAAVSQGGTLQGTAGTSGTGALAHDSDPDDDTLFVSGIQGGTLGKAVPGQYGHLTLNADGSYSYVADNTGSLTGTAHDTFNYTVSDGQGGTTTTSLDITVQHLNEVFRFYDTKTYDHFYTSSVVEKNSLIANNPNFQYEGAQWSTPDKGADTIDVFRFYDTVHGTHFLTTSVGERDSIIANQHTYNYEGVAFEAYADAGTSGGLTLERFYNTATGNHHYSASAIETYGINHGSAGANWVDEGPGFTVHVAIAAMLNA
ncbi:Ig-like domain-containing protein [Methylobacterium sp. M6A4_1b]